MKDLDIRALTNNQSLFTSHLSRFTLDLVYLSVLMLEESGFRQRPNSNLLTDLPAPKTKVLRQEQLGDLVLKNEAGLNRKNPPWSLIERVVSELQPQSDNKFAILEKTLDWSYVQTLRVPEGWLIEWRAFFDREVNCYTHFRAQTLCPSSDPDLCTLEQVIDAFRSFYRHAMPPARLKWRELDT